MNNRVIEILGIKYPIVQGGMMEISRASLTAAVSNAGGLGTLGQRVNIKAWRDDILETKELTDKPFSVNLPLHTPDLEKKLEIILEEGIKVVTTAAGNPKRVLGELKAAGITVLHVVASVAQARKVEEAGVDMVVAEGGESGGMVARDRVSTMVLIPAVVDAVKIPVIAAGGIADYRGLVAALALGAEGVQLGTRFIATHECDAAGEWKEAVCKACDTDTRVVPRGSAQGRVLKDEVLPGAMAGIAAGLICQVESVKEVIDKMVEKAGLTVERVRTQVAAFG